VLITFIPEQHVGKLQKECPDLVMDTMICAKDLSFAILKNNTLRCARRTYPQAVDAELHLCQWLGHTVGKDKLKLLHGIGEDNCEAILMLLEDSVGTFGLTCVPKYDKGPSMLERLMKMVPSRKRRRLNSDLV
jgi:hypothetical protein